MSAFNPGNNERMQNNGDWFTFWGGEWRRESTSRYRDRMKFDPPLGFYEYGMNRTPKKTTDSLDIKVNVDTKELDAAIAKADALKSKLDALKPAVREANINMRVFPPMVGDGGPTLADCKAKFHGVSALGMGKSYHQWMSFVEALKAGKKAVYYTRRSDGTPLAISELEKVMPSQSDIYFDEIAEFKTPAKPADPTPGSVWRHYNGRKYRVLFLTNHVVQRKGHPVDVVYENLNGGKPQKFSRPLSDWHRSFKPEYANGGVIKNWPVAGVVGGIPADHRGLPKSYTQFVEFGQPYYPSSARTDKYAWKPKVHSVWKRRSTGTQYIVHMVTDNESDTQVIIRTRGENTGYFYSCPLKDFPLRFQQ